MFRDGIGIYADFLRKEPGDVALLDPDEGQTSWALMADKGYTGACASVRAIIPKKATEGALLDGVDQAANERIARARVKCEHFYGRMKGLFSITTNRFKGKRKT